MLILLAQQYQRLRRLDQARRCFELAVAADPPPHMPKSASRFGTKKIAIWTRPGSALKLVWSFIRRMASPCMSKRCCCIAKVPVRKPKRCCAI